MKNIRMRAQITVLAAIVTGLVMSLLCASIRSAVDTAVKVRADMAAYLAVESAFANYSRPLADRFNILLLPSSRFMEEAIFKKAEQNCEKNSGFGRSIVQSVDIMETVAPTDRGGVPFAEGVVKYMSYGIFSEFMHMVSGYEEQLEREKKANELINEIAECEEDMAKIDELVLELISLSEGLGNKDGFFECSEGLPVAKDSAFIKQISPESVTEEIVMVRDPRVFHVMRDKYCDVKNIFKEIQDLAGSLGSMKESGTEYEAAKAGSLLSSDIRRAQDLINGSTDACEAAIDVCRRYIAVKAKIQDKAGRTKDNIESSREMLDEDVAEGLLQDVERIREFSSQDAICDAENIYSSIRDVLPYFMSLQRYIGEIRELLEIEGYKEINDTAGYMMTVLNSVNYRGIEFDYSDIEFKRSSSGNRILKTLKNTLSRGVLGLVVEDASYISDKRLMVYDLADDMYSDVPSGTGGFLRQVKENVLYNEYVVANFTSYTDIGCKGKNSDGEEDDVRTLDYQIEYILNGSGSDSDNLYKTVMALSGIREGSNMLCLFTDSAKKEECYALSLALFGFTGMPAAVTAGKYVIMALWAYAESLVEIRQLLAGGRVELIKNNRDWNLSLQKLLELDLKTDKNTSEGLDYEDFLRILLFLEKGSSKYFRTMAQIELWMIEEGFEDFRMKDQISGLCVDVIFKSGGFNDSRYHKSRVSYGY